MAKIQKMRTTPVDLINEKTTYDAGRYIELLAQVCNSVTEPFGCAVSSQEFENGQVD
jgi:hypothetical protein